MKILAERLQELRESHGLSIEAVARELDPPVSTKTVRNWLQDRGDPGLENLVALCRLFGVTPDYLVGMTDAPPATNGSVSRDPGGATPEDLAGEALASRAVRGAKGAPRSRARRRDPGPG